MNTNFYEYKKEKYEKIKKERFDFAPITLYDLMDRLSTFKIIHFNELDNVIIVVD